MPRPPLTFHILPIGQLWGVYCPVMGFFRNPISTSACWHPNMEAAKTYNGPFIARQAALDWVRHAPEPYRSDVIHVVMPGQPEKPAFPPLVMLETHSYSESNHCLYYQRLAMEEREISSSVLYHLEEARKHPCMKRVTFSITYPETSNPFTKVQTHGKQVSET